MQPPPLHSSPTFPSLQSKIPYPLIRFSRSLQHHRPWPPQLCILFLQIYLFWIFQINGITQYVTFCVCVCNIVHTIFCFSNHLVMNIWLIFTFGLLEIMLLWTYMYLYLFSILWVYSQEWSCRVTEEFSVYVFSNGRTVFHSRWPFSVPISNVWGFPFLHTLASTYFPLKISIVILVSMKWYLIVVLICIWLMMLSIFHVFARHLYIFFAEMFIQVLWPILIRLCFFFVEL